MILPEISTFEGLSFRGEGHFSQAFKDAALKSLDSPNIVIGTIARSSSDFIKEIKSRGDIKIHEVTPGNGDSLPDLILKEVAGLFSNIPGV